VALPDAILCRGEQPLSLFIPSSKKNSSLAELPRKEDRIGYNQGMHRRNYDQSSVAQPFYTRGTLNIVEESWRHTNPILNIVGGGGEMDVLLSNSIY
jgi:hypothetical protein